MNAGGHGSDIAANIVSATVVRAKRGADLEEVPAGQLGLGYRTSAIESSDVVVAATFRLVSGSVEESEAELRSIVRWRREHQPGGANCGSVFSNPAGDSAGRLIDRCSLKGHRIGSASVSEKHANFIQADPNAKADDISALIVFVQSAVKDRFGIELHPEVQTLGIYSLQRTKTVSGPENHR
jgi:UDP-N-acetylmuramate dehydrogenase